MDTLCGVVASMTLARRIAGLVSSGGSAVTVISPPGGGMMQVESPLSKVAPPPTR